MYDSLSNDYDIPITASLLSSSTNHDYDIPQGSGKKIKCTAVTIDDWSLLS